MPIASWIRMIPETQKSYVEEKTKPKGFIF